MQDKDLQRFRCYETLVKKMQKTDNPIQKPPSCSKCPYYRPEFRYRRCLYARCPFYRGAETFRKRPLKRDRIPGPEAVKMDV